MSEKQINVTSCAKVSDSYSDFDFSFCSDLWETNQYDQLCKGFWFWFWFWFLNLFRSLRNKSIWPAVQRFLILILISIFHSVPIFEKQINMTNCAKIKKFAVLLSTAPLIWILYILLSRQNLDIYNLIPCKKLGNFPVWLESHPPPTQIKWYNFCIIDRFFAYLYSVHLVWYILYSLTSLVCIIFIGPR